MNDEAFIYFNLYLSTSLWTLTTFLGALDSAFNYLRERRALGWARSLGNGRVILAEGRCRIALWFLIAFLSGLIIAGLAATSLFVKPLPDVDTSVTQLSLRYLIIFMVFSFWRAKRANIRTQERLDARE